MTILLFIIGLNVAYLMVFAFASHLPRKKNKHTVTSNSKVLVVFPSYAEDAVIKESVRSAMEQSFPKDFYNVTVISDHMKEETDEELRNMGARVIVARYENSSKAKALKLAMRETADEEYDRIVILDADNCVEKDFLKNLNTMTCNSDNAIQCHRTSLKATSEVQQLDGISEEINNSIFRRGHVRLGLSSALIGSGMCFDYSWFRLNVDKLSTTGEDKELEKLLLEQHIHIDYAEDINVYDAKTDRADRFQRQRQRWMAAQLYALKTMAKGLGKAVAELNIDYIDKTVQQALIPRVVLIVLCFLCFCTDCMLIGGLSVSWFTMNILLGLALLTAMPNHFYSAKTFQAALRIPQLALLMIMNIFHLKGKTKNFVHTEHESQKEN